MTDCLITENGNGLRIRNSSPLITNCRVEGNGVSGAVTDRHGVVIEGPGSPTIVGGIHVMRGTLTAQDCVITGNEGSLTGGVHVDESVTVDLVGCTISGNLAGSRGGGVTCVGDVSLDLRCRLTLPTGR